MESNVSCTTKHDFYVNAQSCLCGNLKIRTNACFVMYGITLMFQSLPVCWYSAILFGHLLDGTGVVWLSFSWLNRRRAQTIDGLLACP